MNKKINDIDVMHIEITGTTPLLLHNGRTGNPLDPFTKRLKSLTSKKTKTEDDYQAILELGWEAALYMDDKRGLYLPSENLFAAFMSGAKKHKWGQKMSAISFDDPVGYSILLPKNDKWEKVDLETLKADPDNRFVKMVTVQKSKNMSCRPCFKLWKLYFSLEFDSDMIDANEIKTILVTMTKKIGLGVWRPNSPKPGTYGKFEINRIEWINKSGLSTQVKGAAA